MYIRNIFVVFLSTGRWEPTFTMRVISSISPHQLMLAHGIDSSTQNH